MTLYFKKLPAWITLAAIPVFAQGDLILMDLSAQFRGGSQKEIVKFMNSTNDTLRYSLRLTERFMDKNGSLIQTNIDSLPGNNYPASPYLRIFPRSVVLGPQEMQSVAIQYRKTSDMTPGEYRSHLSFIPDKKIGELGLPQNNLGNTAVGVDIKTSIGVSIPVRILVDDIKIEAAIKNIKLGKNASGLPTVSMDIFRIGNRSISGAVYVEHIHTSGQVDTVATGHLSVYREIDSRSVNLDLEKMPINGKLRVQCIQIDGDDRSVLASEMISL